jgi:hypothetical protein
MSNIAVVSILFDYPNNFKPTFEEKYDISNLGHITGTGLVIFN